jgi:hypothetical protein
MHVIYKSATAYPFWKNMNLEVDTASLNNKKPENNDWIYN